MLLAFALVVTCATKSSNKSSSGRTKPVAALRLRLSSILRHPSLSGRQVYEAIRPRRLSSSDRRHPHRGSSFSTSNVVEPHIAPSPGLSESTALGKRPRRYRISRRLAEDSQAQPVKMVARPLIALVSLLFTAGACLLIFLTLLGGAVSSSPENQIYFLRVDTSAIKGAPATTEWTFWNYCDGSSGSNANCTSVTPAYPFDPASNFATDQGVPDAFKGTNEFYLLSRFFFAFTLIALFFAVVSLFLGVTAACFRIGGVFSGLVAAFALFWQVAGASLMTACFVIGRNRFNDNNQTASIGQMAFGFMWAAVACLLISTVLYFSVLATGRRDTDRRSRRGFFGRKRSTRSRGSFLDHDRFAKDEEATSFERSR